jgi:hypothetical protein
LFSTIALDLAGSNKNFAEAIDLALEQQRSLASAPLCRQFDELILKPFQQYPVDKPVVVVIDALDESYSANHDINELLAILRDDVPKLPGSFSILLTSRPLEAVDAFLAEENHISRLTIDIHASANRGDIAIYAQAQLKAVARFKKLGNTWPDEQLLKDFIRTAEGLFLWVSIICKYICTTVSPETHLKSLVSRRNPRVSRAEVKMDKLYVTILKSCNWDDEEFAEGYKLLMGTIIAAKSPLSTQALQAFHDTSLTAPASALLRPLGSLLTGLTDTTQFVRIPHLSFRDFLTVRAQLSPISERFYLDEKEHSQRLALQCLLVLNENLREGIPGTGYLVEDVSVNPGIPEIAEGQISEEVWYACRFWPDHIVDVESPVSVEFIAALHNLLSTKIVLWMEIVTAKGKFRNLRRVREWLQVLVIFHNAVL